jgi:hypothetical protein
VRAGVNYYNLQAPKTPVSDHTSDAADGNITANPRDQRSSIHAATQTITFVALGMFSVCAIGLAINRVDDSLTAEDSAFIASYLQSERIDGFPGSEDYAGQLAYIRRVQTAVLDSAYIFKAIPMRHEREPRDVILAKGGVCHDRSRVIEKILRYAGFSTRHVFILSVGNRSPLVALLLPGLRSHAVTEVLTVKGWLVVDSNDPWISIDKQGDPESISEIETLGITHRISWHEAPPNSIYTEPFIAIYGLYSRHGQFYPPYAPVPNVNFGELLANWQDDASSSSQTP